MAAILPARSKSPLPTAEGPALGGQALAGPWSPRGGRGGLSTSIASVFRAGPRGARVFGVLVAIRDVGVAAVAAVSGWQPCGPQDGGGQCHGGRHRRHGHGGRLRPGPQRVACDATASAALVH